MNLIEKEIERIGKKPFNSRCRVRSGGGGLTTICIKIGYSSREPRSVVLPCFKIGYVSSMF